MKVVLWVAAAAVGTVLALLLLWPSGPEATTVTVQTGQHTVSLTVDNPKLGPNTLDFDVTDRAGQPVTVDTIPVELVMTQMGHALPPVTAAQVEPGRYRASDTDIPMAGVWDVTVSLPGHENAVFSLLVE